MTAAERRALARLVRQANAATPDLQAAILRAFRLLREGVSEAAVVRALQAGDVLSALDALVPLATLDRSLNGASGTLQREVARVIRSTAPLMPARARAAVIGFGELDPRILRAIQQLDSTSLRVLAEPVREAVRQGIRAGLEAGVSPRTMARELRAGIGLAPNQRDAVESFRRALEGGRGGTPSTTILPRTNAIGGQLEGRALRDGRFDATIRKAIASKTPLTPAQINAMVDRYRARMIAFHAETHARTAALEAQKLGQQLAWQEAKLAGTLDGVNVIRRWVTTMDGRERPEHAAMDGQTAPLDGRYSNGQSYPGETEFNCRCTEVISVGRPAL